MISPTIFPSATSVFRHINYSKLSKNKGIPLEKLSFSKVVYFQRSHREPENEPAKIRFANDFSRAEGVTSTLQATGNFSFKQNLRFLKIQANLRAILKPLAEQNWPQKYQQEFKRSHALRAAIEATKEAIDKTKR